MKRKILLLFLIISMIFTGCGSKAAKPENTAETETESTISSDSPTETETETQIESFESESLETEESVESAESETALKTEEDVFSVKVTIPANLYGIDGTMQEQLDKDTKELKSTLNADGSVTLEMTKEKYEEFLQRMKAEVSNAIDAIVKNKTDYPSFKEITYNKEMTEFNVVTTAKSAGEFSLSESLTGTMVDFLASFYQVFDGKDTGKAHVKVTYTNDATGEIISTYESQN